MGSANVVHMKKFHTVHISKNTAACQRSPSTVMNSYGDKGVSKFDSGLTAPQQIWDNGAPGHTKATASSDEQALPFPSEKGQGVLTTRCSPSPSPFQQPNRNSAQRLRGPRSMQLLCWIEKAEKGIHLFNPSSPP